MCHSKLKQYCLTHPHKCTYMVNNVNLYEVEVNRYHSARDCVSPRTCWIKDQSLLQPLEPQRIQHDIVDAGEYISSDFFFKLAGLLLHYSVRCHGLRTGVKKKLLYKPNERANTSVILSKRLRQTRGIERYNFATYSPKSAALKPLSAMTHPTQFCYPLKNTCGNTGHTYTVLPNTIWF